MTMLRNKGSGYLRRSTDRQDKSIEDQKREILAYASAHGFEIVRFYIDDAISGTSTDDRKAFLQMIADAREESCEWSYVLVYDVKRFGRVDNDEAGHYRFLLRQAGIEVVYISENFAGDDSDDLIRPVKQWQARQESKDLSKVTIRGQVSLSEDGWWLGGVPPYGYDLLYHDSASRPYMIVRFMPNGDKQLLELDGRHKRTLPRGESLALSKKDHAKLIPSLPERVALIRRIFEMYASGRGYRAIAEQLNAERVPSPRTSDWASIHDGRWSMSTIREIIDNPNYSGDAVWNRRTLGKFHRISNRQATARSAQSRNRIEENAKENWIVKPKGHEGLVDRELFEKVRRLCQDRGYQAPANAFRRGRAKGSEYLLSGLLKCGRSNHRLQGYTVTKLKPRKNGERVRTLYYVCGGYVSKGTSVCERVLFRQDRLDDWVAAKVMDQMTQYLAQGGLKLLRQSIKESLAQRNGSNHAHELGEIRRRRDDLQKKADELLDMMSPANRDFIDEKLVRLRKEREALSSRLAELEAMKAATHRSELVAERIVEELKGFRGIFETGTPEEKKAFLRAFVREIRLDPDGRKGVLRIRKFPPPTLAGDGNSSFTLVAGVGFEPTTSGL